MRAYAFIESRRSILWPLWSGALALFVTLGVPPLALCLASGALMTGRVLEASDRVSAERCRRVMSVVGLVATPVAAAVCERLHVAPGTVKSARTRCYRALDVHSAAELRKYLEGRAGLTDFAEEHPRG